MVSLFSHISRTLSLCYTPNMTKKQKAEARVRKVRKERALHIEVVRQMVTLSTSGFGLVAALAWNSVIQEFVNNYIKKWLPRESGIISLLIYALIITVLAVVITTQLTKLKKRLENKR